MEIKIGQMQEGNESKIIEREEGNGLKYMGIYITEKKTVFYSVWCSNHTPGMTFIKLVLLL